MPVLHCGRNQQPLVKLYQAPRKTDRDPPHLPAGSNNLPGRWPGCGQSLSVTALVAVLPKNSLRGPQPASLNRGKQQGGIREVDNGQLQRESNRHFVSFRQHPGADGYLGSSREPIATIAIRCRGYYYLRSGYPLSGGLRLPACACSGQKYTFFLREETNHV